MLNDETFYCMTLEDYTLPIFYSNYFIYFAPMDTIKEWAEIISSYKLLQNRYHILLEAVNNYESNPEATHTVSGHNLRVLIPMKVIARSEQILENQDWVFTGFTGGAFPLKCESADISQVILEWNDSLFRCGSASFTGLKRHLQYLGWQHDFFPIDSTPFMISYQDPVTEILMYSLIQKYDLSEKEKAIRDMNNPGEKELICLSHDLIGRYASLY